MFASTIPSEPAPPLVPAVPTLSWLNVTVSLDLTDVIAVPPNRLSVSLLILAVAVPPELAIMFLKIA